SQNGADHQERKGPQRAVQSGAISMKAMKRAVYLFLILSFTSGISLLLWSLGLDFKTLTVFLGLGIASLAAAIFYTMGKRPYGYAGLGDISVLVFFGIIGVLGTYYLQIGTLTWPLILPALTCGLFSVGVLNLNNVRDIDSDKMAGKMSVPVRIGPANARVYHWFLLISGLLSAIVYGVFFFDNYLNWVFLVTVPLFLMNGWKLQKASNSTQIDPLLKQLALSTLLFVLLFGTFALI
ncbi:MAG: 1,4-dihydroxy-2-naphthoate octaprenyltransferase, partial [Cyclobacteriaceae bacterium]|nr:1,4-dihydroxy-2-naphthoate octaprenyltransferase [Cyclobacteriaceae bacterium]